MPQQQQLAIAINIFETLALCSEICFGIEATFTEGYFHAFEVARELRVVIIKVGMLDQTVGKGSWTHVRGRLYDASMLDDSVLAFYGLIVHPC